MVNTVFRIETLMVLSYKYENSDKDKVKRGPSPPSGSEMLNNLWCHRGRGKMMKHPTLW